jgi:predicted enzyme related to lactoylglutathione lyase
MEHREPAFRHGKICYLEIPAVNIRQSAFFYTTVFGWTTRQGADGFLSFDDGIGGVSGTWVLNIPPLSQPGILISIMVDNAIKTVQDIVANGGTIVREVNLEAVEKTAHFRDPAGNVLGIYEHGGN